MLSSEDYQGLPGRTVVGQDGKQIGKVDQLYADREGGHPTFITVNSGLFGMRTHFVPVAEARMDGDSLVVPYTTDTVKQAPSIADESELSVEEEDRLYRHYGLTSPTAGADTAAMGTGAAGLEAGGGDLRRDHPVGMAGTENAPWPTEHPTGMAGQEGAPAWPAPHEPGMAGQPEPPMPAPHPTGMAGQVQITGFRLRRWMPGDMGTERGAYPEDPNIGAADRVEGGDIRR
jgi:hypothetical protein